MFVEDGSREKMTLTGRASLYVKSVFYALGNLNLSKTLFRFANVQTSPLFEKIIFTFHQIVNRFFIPFPLLLRLFFFVIVCNTDREAVKPIEFRLFGNQKYTRQVND
jgi:hypothetical protein